MKHLTLIILAIGTLALKAQSYTVDGDASISGGVDISSTTTVDGGVAPAPLICEPAPAPVGPVVRGRVVYGTGLVATGGVCTPRPVVVTHTRVMSGGCQMVRGRNMRRYAPVVCPMPARRCGDPGFYYGQRSCR